MSPGGVPFVLEHSMNVVWIIDGEQWPRALLRAELLERGFDAVGYLAVRDAIDAVLERPPDAIVVDLLGQPMPVVERLLQIGVPVLVIGGALELQDLPPGPWAAILKRPVSIGEIAETVTALLRSRP